MRRLPVTHGTVCRKMCRNFFGLTPGVVYKRGWFAYRSVQVDVLYRVRAEGILELIELSGGCHGR